MFHGINKRLVGVGVVSVYSSYIFSFYYNVVVAWSLVYFIVGWVNPLPWSASKTDFVDRCSATSKGISRAE